MSRWPRRLRLALLLAASLALGFSLTACGMTRGSVSAPPKVVRFLKVDRSAKKVTLTLIAGYPGAATEFNFDGYSNGQMTVTVPVGWQVNVECKNQGTVAHSCSIANGSATSPANPGWTTAGFQVGIQPNSSSSFQFTPAAAGDYRIACLVPGHEGSGMWENFQVVASGSPSISASSG